MEQVECINSTREYYLAERNNMQQVMRSLCWAGRCCLTVQCHSFHRKEWPLLLCWRRVFFFLSMDVSSADGRLMMLPLLPATTRTALSPKTRRRRFRRWRSTNEAATAATEWMHASWAGWRGRGERGGWTHHSRRSGGPTQRGQSKVHLTMSNKWECFNDKCNECQYQQWFPYVHR